MSALTFRTEEVATDLWRVLFSDGTADYEVTDAFSTEADALSAFAVQLYSLGYWDTAQWNSTPWSNGGSA